jgi:Domain of unknown function (DUF4412)
MKPILLALLATASHALADMVVVQQVEGAGQSARMTIRLKDDKVRTDVGDQISMINNGTSGDTITMMHAQKRYMKVPAEMTKALMQQAAKKQNIPENAGEPEPLKSTGKKEKISGYDTEEYTRSIGGIDVQYWLAKDFPDYVAVLKQLQKAQQPAIDSLPPAMRIKPEDFPGLPVRTVATMNGQKVTSTILSVTSESVDPESFTVPEGYEQIQTPVLPQPPE